MYDYLKDKNVLYVEDEVDVLENISILLKSFFNNFYKATDGIEALEIYETHQIDLLLVDIELPKMNGIEFIKKIREHNQDVMIVVISAYTKTDYLLESVELGLSKYIVKPLTSKKIHELLEMINQYFSGGKIVHLTPDIEVNGFNSTIRHNGEEFHLTKKELELLMMFAKKKIVSYDEIASLWRDEVPTENAIRTFIKYLRKKLPPNILKNQSGVGYYIESDNDQK